MAAASRVAMLTRKCASHNSVLKRLVYDVEHDVGGREDPPEPACEPEIVIEVPAAPSNPLSDEQQWVDDGDARGYRWADFRHMLTMRHTDNYVSTVANSLPGDRFYLNLRLHGADEIMRPLRYALKYLSLIHI